MMSPATQPSSAPPPQTSTRKRSSSAIRIALPATISGTLVASPKMISVVLIAGGMREVDLRRRGFRRRRNGDHVVEAHHDVGDGDDAHRAPQRLRALDAAVVAVGVLGDELDRHIEQQRPPTSFRNG